MRITSVFPTRTFKLVLEFDQKEYRILNIKDFLKNDLGKLAEIRDDIDMFLTVSIDDISGTIIWDNHVDFDTKVVYEHSIACPALGNHVDAI